VGRLYAIRDEGALRVEVVEERATGGEVQFALSGHAVAWPYRGKVVTILSPKGGVIGTVDLLPVIARDEVEREHLGVQCAWIDETRGLWFVGTSHGLAVGRLDEQSQRPAVELRRVERLGTAGPLTVGSFLGRVLLVVEHDGKGTEGAILLEDGFGTGPGDAPGFAKAATFTAIPRSPTMGPPSRAIMVAPDVVWAVAFGGMWEWTPAGWQHLDADIGLPRPHETRARPMVLANLLRDRLWCLRPRASEGFRESSAASAPLHVAVSDTCPDPSGGGVWIWDQKTSPPDMDYVRFATPHAVADNRDGTGHPAGFEVARVTHRQADGTVHAPVARGGALLLPTGSDFLLCRAGRWAETDRSSLSGARFVELTPGARSAEAAWLAIRQGPDGPQPLVAIDVDPETPPDKPPRLTVDELGPTVPAGVEAALVPDSTGSVWLAAREGDGWRLRKILPVPGFAGRGASLFARGLSEVPRFLFLSAMPLWLGDGLLLTDTGGCRVAHADRIGADDRGLSLLTPDVGPWTSLWTDRPAPQAGRVEYTVVVSRRWGVAAGDARAIALRRPAGDPDVEAYVIAATAESPGVRVESAERRLEGGLLRGFRPRLWFPGVNEYVVGEVPSRPAQAAALLAVPVDGISSVSSGSWLRVVADDLNPQYGQRLSGIAVNRLGGRDADVLAVAGGYRVAFEDVSALADPPLFVPTTIEVHASGSAPRAYDVRDGLPPAPLPAAVDQISVRVAPDYGDWWRPEPGLVALRDKASPNPGESFPLASGPGGVAFQVPMSPGIRRELTPSTDAWPSPVASELPSLTFQVAPPPAGMNPWWLLATLPAAIVAALIGVAASTEFYQRVVALFGFRPVFSDRQAPAVVFIRSDGAGGAALRRTGEALARPVSLPPRPADFDDLRQSWRDEAAANGVDPFLIWANVDRDLFPYDWNACLSDEWTDSEGRVFSGQIYGVAAGERLPDVPARRGPMIVTALGCGVRDGDPPFPMMDVLVDRTARSFEAPGFRVVARVSDATPDDLAGALRSSDIVLIFGHAEGGALRFPDGDFGASSLRDLADQLRCRFMVFLGCGLGDVVASSDPLLLELVSRGVTCLASSHSRQDIIIARSLLPAFCEGWRAGRGTGPTIAEALRGAASRVGHYKDEAAEASRDEDINSYVIIGTPTLRLEWRWAGRRASR
jgi:hypothetical protein